MNFSPPGNVAEAILVITFVKLFFSETNIM